MQRRNGVTFKVEKMQIRNDSLEHVKLAFLAFQGVPPPPPPPHHHTFDLSTTSQNQ